MNLQAQSKKEKNKIKRPQLNNEKRFETGGKIQFRKRFHMWKKQTIQDIASFPSLFIFFYSISYHSCLFYVKKIYTPATIWIFVMWKIVKRKLKWVFIVCHVTFLWKSCDVRKKYKNQQKSMASSYIIYSNVIFKYWPRQSGQFDFRRVYKSTSSMKMPYVFECKTCEEENGHTVTGKIYKQHTHTYT